MTNISKGLDTRVFLLLPALSLILTNLAVFLDIPILRQVLAFLFLTFVPGFLILSILKLNKLGLTEKIVLSVGLSVAFSMLFGLALNGSLLAIGYTQPLSTASLLISFSTATIIMAVIAYIRNKGITLSLSNLKLTTKEKALLIVPALFPLLSIAGTHIMNLTDNNIILMVLLFLIPAYVIFISFSNRKVSEKVYPIAILLISISLLLMFPLRSNHIVMAESAGREFYYFLITLDNLHWRMFEPFILNSCLSVTLLPAIYQSFLEVNLENLENLFKLLYCFLFSISPLVIYILAKKYIGSFYAFLASFFFMSQSVFLWTAGEARVNMAILFCALAVMALFHDKISDVNKKILFIIFVFCAIVSHYAAGYIFFFILLAAWIIMQVLPRLMSRSKKQPTASESQPGEGSLPHTTVVSKKPTYYLRKNITALTVALVFSMIFLWYSQVTRFAFTAGVGFIKSTILSLEELFTWESRHFTAPGLFGQTMPQAVITHRIEFIITWATFALIAIGVISMVFRHKEMVFIPGQEHLKSEFLKTKIEVEYLAMAIVGSLLLVAMVALPFISTAYEYHRLYLLVLTILSPCLVIGGISLAKYIKLPASLVILVVLVPWFICVTGLLDQTAGIPRTITLNSVETSLNSGALISEQESCASKWLGEYADRGRKIHIHNHVWSQWVECQGKFSIYQFAFFGREGYQEGDDAHYIYLRDRDITTLGVTGTDREFLMAEHPGVLAGSSKIYTNGGPEVLYK